jgi:hypothetical protein
MTFGPLDFIALEFPGNRFRGDILPELFDLVQSGIIRIVDMVIVLKREDGSLMVRELQELDRDHIAVIDPLKAESNQMITQADIDMIAGQLDNNSTAGLMLIENLWAKKVKQSMLDANGKLLFFERIPHDVVEEALADIAALAASEA